MGYAAHADAVSARQEDRSLDSRSNLGYVQESLPICSGAEAAVDGVEVTATRAADLAPGGIVMFFSKITIK